MGGSQVLLLLLSSATILGAVRMYRRVEARTLAVVSLALCAVWLVNLVLAIVLAGQFDVLSVLLLALAVGVAVGVRRPEVRAWVA